ncbi:MAG: pilus assembly protein [Alphaproteobacteria bacterium]|nr:pilus assembly protein [Alphaproteobacteria bacterium]
MSQNNKHKNETKGKDRLFGVVLKRFLSARTGVATIEFAMTMPVLIMLLAGSINFGHVIYVRHTMQAVAGEALRSVSYGQLDYSDAVTFAKGQLPRLQKGKAKWDVTIVENAATNEVRITISVDTKAASLMPLPYVSAEVFADELSVELVAPRITAFNPT